MLFLNNYQLQISKHLSSFTTCKKNGVFCLQLYGLNDFIISLLPFAINQKNQPNFEIGLTRNVCDDDDVVQYRIRQNKLAPRQVLARHPYIHICQ